MTKLQKRIVAIIVCLLLVFVLWHFGTKESSTAFEGTADGFGGEVKVAVTVDGNTITGINVTAEKETPEVGGKAIEKLKEKVLANQSADIDVISGATFSSTAFITALNAALKEGNVTLAGTGGKAAEDVEKTVDVVVVGGGGAGMTAAITAAEEGKNVLLIEKNDILGGNTTRASSGMNACETHYEKEQGVEDSVKSFVEDTMKGGKELNDPALVQFLAENSSAAIDWLDKEGAELKGPLTTMGGLSAKRTHRPVDEEGNITAVGNYLASQLSKKMDELKIETMTGTEVKSIIMENDKASGVIATSDGNNKITVHASAVIVATGGFGGNMDMVVKYRPDLKGYISTNVPTASGDAIAFLGEVGAEFIDMDQIQLHPTVIPTDGALVGEALRGDGAILVNKEGLRFTDERGTRDAVSAAEVAQTDGNVWLIVNQEMYDVSAIIQKLDKKGYMVKGETLDDLAKAMSFDDAATKNFKDTMAKWVTYVEKKEDPDFNRKIDTEITDLSKGTYYAVNVGPGIHHCMGGVKIDTSTHVLTKEGKPIAGLYACGEVTGGVHGANRLGGNAVADIVVFGRQAGKVAVEEMGK
ncbi:flavocytochrome c [Butyrivibrio sp. NC3005]|jgi:fumarate reductase flavoprotein subunit|uniref:flavocytochrome c n=1 Tax=Butyrivibrio sp. NC3005 TaxID=1280685 RepID=UPI0003FF2177|nr:flavocytochrome c [Butyrivibrio sp. NC3005]